MYYKEISIENLRGIDKLELRKLNQINVLIGKNSSGKSTVLEGVFLLSGMSNPILAGNINLFRGLNTLTDEGFKVLFRNLDLDNHPYIKSIYKDHVIRSVKLSGGYNSNEIKQNLLDNSNQISATSKGSTNSFVAMEGLVFSYSDGKLEWQANMSLKHNKIFIPPNYKESLKCAIIPSNYLLDDLAFNISNIIQKKEIGNVVKILQDIEPRIKKIEMGFNNLVMADIGISEQIPVQALGDGLLKLILYISTLYNNSNGVVIIDEIENGFHYSALKVMWKAIFKACDEFNIQLFVSTHSLECIAALYEYSNASTKYKDIYNVYRIDRNEKEQKAVLINAANIKTVIEQNMEIR